MKTMLKSQVSFCFSGIAFALAMPTTANPAQQSATPGKNVVYTAGAHARTTKNDKIASPIPGRNGMKFVNRYIRNNDECLEVVRQRSEGPFMIIDSVLQHYGLPLELKYLAVIESELKPSALSRVGAKGPWQLMKSTAHALGLKVNRQSDDRTNYYKSTRAAAKYLRDLHKEFGDWLLVLAAYNGGPRPVYRAIHKSHSRSFWAIQRYLPAESRQHVKKFIATAYYFERADSVNTLPAATATAAPVTPERPATPTNESANDRFKRLMLESAQSLKASNELLGNAN
jgi:hypothetical protein